MAYAPSGSKEPKSSAEIVLVVDVGNQITRFGLFGKTPLARSWTITTKESVTIDEARLSIEAFLVHETERPFAKVLEGEGGFDSILSSVVPDHTHVWTSALATICGRKPLVVGPGLKTGIKMKYNDPSELGSDRIATIVAAKEFHGFPLVVIDCGTVINYQTLDSEGAFVGGLITPGLDLSAKALSQAAARLPIVELTESTSVLGKNSRESIKAGIIFGEVGRIEGLLERIWSELGYKTRVVLVGKDAHRLAPLLNFEPLVDDDLTLQGLNILYDMNRRRS